MGEKEGTASSRTKNPALNTQKSASNSRRTSPNVCNLLSALPPPVALLWGRDRTSKAGYRHSPSNTLATSPTDDEQLAT